MFFLTRNVEIKYKKIHHDANTFFDETVYHSLQTVWFTECFGSVAFVKMEAQCDSCNFHLYKPATEF